MTSSLHFFYSDYFNYESDEQALYNPNDYPEIKDVIAHYTDIRNEVEDYINGKFDIQYVNPGAPNMTYPDSWKNIYFKNYLLDSDLGKKYFPKTHRFFDERPEITLAGITKLAPKSKLLSHCGETNAIIRCHMGLKVPGKLPELGLIVKGHSVCWEEGKVFAFNDAFQHEAWNDTNEFRYVLIFDFMRPEFAEYRIWICARCLGIESMRFLLGKIGVYEKTPLWLRAAIAKPVAILLWVYLKLKGN
jgi:ornithine lipid ester-linked acyl 2-hydroxylase